MVRVRYLLLIEGKVQRGGFRSFVKKHALLLGVTGYAENLPTGEVVAVLEGEGESINKLIDVIEREAPAYIRVERITKRGDEYRGTFADFERKGSDVLGDLDEEGVREILLNIASYSKSTDEKLERGVEILSDIKGDTSTMLEKQDETIETIKSVKGDTSAMFVKQEETIEVMKEEGEKNRRVIKDHLAQDIARIYEEIDGIKATLAKIMEKVGT